MKCIKYLNDFKISNMIWPMSFVYNLKDIRFCSMFVLTKMVFPLLVIFGEDVAFGGVFRCTVGLKDKYG